ncbi:MAG: hypothetical protein IT320_05980 [Anaerolineae bacterium]|nr:hypothetical protein [Anaerolineae bacterium]
MATTYILNETIHEAPPAAYERLMANLTRKSGGGLFGSPWDVVQVDALTTQDNLRAMQVLGFTTKLYGSTFGETVRQIVFHVILAEVDATQTQARIIVSHPTGHFHPDDPSTPIAHMRLYRRCVQVAEALLEFCLKPPPEAIDRQISGLIRQVMANDKTKRKRG